MTLLRCKKSSDTSSLSSPHFDPTLEQTIPPVIASDTTAAPFPYSAALGCPNGPNYGSTTVYLQPSAGPDYVIQPQNSLAQGKFYAWPSGLAIDANSGAINLTKSVTGVQYAIGYVRSGSNDTCLSTLIVSGASYKDSIYILKGPTMATPYFDGKASGGPVCGPGPAGKCAWDLSGSATGQHLQIDLKNGNIDLRASLDHKMFGDHPANGAELNSVIYYHLDDASNNAVQSLTLRFLYYEHAIDVPADLQNQISSQASKVNTGSMLSVSKSPRPPLIVVVRAQ